MKSQRLRYMYMSITIEEIGYIIITIIQIDRKEIDHFIPESFCVSQCHFKFCWRSELSPPKLLKMKFHLIGAKKPNNIFHIFLPRDSLPGILLMCICMTACTSRNCAVKVYS